LVLCTFTVRRARDDLLAALAHDAGDALVAGRRTEIRRAMSYADETFSAIRPGRIDVVRVLEAELLRLRVHLRDEALGAERRDARQARGRGVVGPMSSRFSRSFGVRTSLARRYVVDAARTSLRSILTGRGEVERVLEEHDRGHHLGDAGDRARVLRVLFPQHLLGDRVVDDGGFGADARHRRSVGGGAEQRRRGFADTRGPAARRGRAPSGRGGHATTRRAGAADAAPVRCARRVPIVGLASGETRVHGGARRRAPASTSAVQHPEVSSARDAASPNRRQDRKIGTANTPLSETIIGILAEKP
jgi:hypothetical protein